MSSLLAKIPSVNELLDGLNDQLAVIDAKYLKILIDEVLTGIKANPEKAGLENKKRDVITAEILNTVKKKIIRLATPPLRHVINGTGVILHTGLGRAPLGAAVIEATGSLAAYTNLEIQLSNGRRGQRLDHVTPLLRLLTGAEDAVVVNNNAAAVLLMLNSIARRKEVIVSRGELVEIGGSFRMPEVMKTSGAKMIEIGATNKTHIDDYEQAISERTAAIMLVHPSNYEIIGFTAKPEIKQIVEIAHHRKVPVMYDLGGGALISMQKFGFDYEPVVEDLVRMGIDLISFSGDKLLGGPQTGIIVGKSAPVRKIKQNHLLRALRCDKLTLAIFAHVLSGYLHAERAINNNPTLSLFNRDISKQQQLLNSIISASSGREDIVLEQVSTFGKVGSGAYPVFQIPAIALKISHSKINADKIARKLRMHEIPIFGYIDNDEYFISMLTLFDHDIPGIVKALNKL